MAKVPVAGEIAMGFELLDSTRAPRQLSELVSEEGRLVLLFYRGNWWPFCLRQLANYREHYPEIRSAGASLVAVSVDSCESSQALRTQLSLPFPILCDTERRVVKDWDIYNSRERGGIAKPAVFVIDPNQVVRYASVDSVATRVPAVEIVHLLQGAANAQAIRRRVHIPMLSEWIRAIRNHFQG
jgi:peroxiredoxin